MTTMTYKHACLIVAANCPDKYAQAYAKAGVALTGDAMRMQCLYILNNIKYWRGEEAALCRAAFNHYGKMKEIERKEEGQ